VHEERTTFQEFPETLVLGELLASSTEFKLFYQSNRHSIKKPIHWVLDVTLPQGIKAKSTRWEKGEQLIHVRRVPAILEDAFSIAHELQHFILDESGFVVTSAIDEYESLSYSLNDIPLDPLVNSCLEIYGFDLRRECDKNIREAFRQLQTLPHSPSNKLVKTQWVFQYVELMLECEVAYKSRRSESEFERLFRRKYPDLSKEASKLIEIVKNMGYDTPDKERAVLEEIIRRYDLGTCLSL